MQKNWLQSYPEGVPESIDADAYQSLIEVFNESVAKYADNPSYENMGTTYSYRELDQKAENFAAYLQKELGLKHGDRLAIMMPNLLQYPVAIFGAMKAGLSIINVNPLYTERELKHQLNDASANALLIVANFADTFEAIKDDTTVEHVIVTELGDGLKGFKSFLVNFVVKHIKKMVPKFGLPEALSYKKMLKKGSELSLEPVALTQNDIAFLQYTGGTTGVSKGAVLTHRNIIANLMQSHAWIGETVNEGKEIVITALPLYHIFSLTAKKGRKVLILDPVWYL